MTLECIVKGKIVDVRDGRKGDKEILHLRKDDGFYIDVFVPRNKNGYKVGESVELVCKAVVDRAYLEVIE